MNVLIIPEDFRKDQYVLEPIIKRMFTAIGRPRANVRICRDPLLGGISQAIRWERIVEVIHRYRGMVDVFLLLVDRDGKAERRHALDVLEGKARVELGSVKAMFAENAWQEIEVWALAGQKLPKDWNWNEIRAEVHPKEVYFEPLARQRGLLNEPGGGRRTMGREAATNYSRVRSRCRKDIQVLEARLAAWLSD